MIKSQNMVKTQKNFGAFFSRTAWNKNGPEIFH